MIRLNEVAKKLEDVLNGADFEVATELGLQNIPGYFFRVATEGFHLDKIYSMGEGKNFIPVFISSMGGEFNPVPDLLQANYVIPVSIYCPVRFKNDLYAINEYIAKAFVGRYLNYGQSSGRAVSNISVAQFGEIQDLDLKQFKEWEETTYKMPIEVMEPYIQMRFNLYLSNAAEGYIFGNDAKLDISFEYDNETYTLKNASFESGSLQSNSQIQSEQEEGTYESDSLPYGTTYGYSIKLYPNTDIESQTEGQTNKKFYVELMKLWFSGYAQMLDFDIKFKFANDSDLVFQRKSCLQSIIAPIEKGQIVSMTLTFLRKQDDQNG